MDAGITGWINGLSGHLTFIDSLMIALATYGVQVMVILVAAQWWSANDRMHVRHTAISAGLAFFLSLTMNQIVLLFVHRVRPYDQGVSHLLIPRSADWSLPSDHSAVVAAVAMIFLLKGYSGRGAALAALGGLVCFARVYVGIHFAGDVLAGIVSGVLAAFIVDALYREGNPVDQRLVRIL